MKNPQTIVEACQYLAELITLIAKELSTNNANQLFGEIKIEGEEWPYDSVVNLKRRVDGKEYDTGYSISPMVEEDVDVLGRSQQNFIRYYVSHEEIIHGVHYRSDGSGEPDTSDLVEDVKTRYGIFAAKKVILLTLEHEWDMMFESIAEEAMAAEMTETEFAYG